jgi:hypothetical protein
LNPIELFWLQDMPALTAVFLGGLVSVLAVKGTTSTRKTEMESIIMMQSTDIIFEPEKDTACDYCKESDRAQAWRFVPLTAARVSSDLSSFATSRWVPRL